jgi:hypothetical protein
MSNDAQRERFEKAMPRLDLSWSRLYSCYDDKVTAESFTAFRAAEAQYEGLLKAGRAVVERWETPSWKDAKPTAGFIYTMRDELDKLEGKS